MAPKFVDGGFLLLIVSRIEPIGSAAQGIDEEHIAAARAGGEERFPSRFGAV